VRFVALLLAIAACGSSSSASEQAATGCDLTGMYRLRFKAAGQRLWFRFRIENVAGKPVGTMVPPIALRGDTRAVEVTPSTGCTFEVAIRDQERGPMFGRFELDPTANTVKGKLRGKDARWGDLDVGGVRDVAGQKSKLWCIQPGRYELVVPNEQAWVASNQNQSCDKASLKLPFLVEYVGDELVIDQLDAKGDAAWAGEDIYETAPCEIEVRMRHHQSYVYAKLVFAGDKVTASATRASVEIEDAGGEWTCTVTSPMIWVERPAT
jgi:hypothetical protein